MYPTPVYGPPRINQLNKSAKGADRRSGRQSFCFYKGKLLRYQQSPGTHITVTLGYRSKPL